MNGEYVVGYRGEWGMRRKRTKAHRFGAPLIALLVVHPTADCGKVEAAELVCSIDLFTVVV